VLDLASAVRLGEQVAKALQDAVAAQAR